MKRTILFDFDGVLADTLDDMLSISKEVCADLGYPRDPSPHDLDALDSMDILSYGRQLELPANRLDEFGARMVEEFRLKQEPPAIFPGLAEVVRQIAQNSHIGIVTGNSTEAVRDFVAWHGLGNYFGCVLGADAPGRRDDKIRQAVESLGGSLDSTFMVGDSVSDVRAAQEVGAISVAVAWGHQTEARLAAAGPRYLVRTPGQLLKLLNLPADWTG